LVTSQWPFRYLIQVHLNYKNHSNYLSYLNLASGLYRIGYYRLICKIPIEKIPINFEVFGIRVFGDQYSMELTGADYSKKTTTFWKYENAIAIDNGDIDNNITDDINDTINNNDDDISETEKKSLLLEMKKEMKKFKKRLDDYEIDLGQVKVKLNIQPDV